MAKPIREWFGRHCSLLMGLMIVLLLIVVVAQGFFLFEQRTATHATETQSAKLLTTFLEGDTTKASGASGVPRLARRTPTAGTSPCWKPG